METITFKQRVLDFWTQFEQKEENLRTLMDEKAGTEELLNPSQELLDVAFDEIYFNVGINPGDEKYELILTPEGDAMQYYCTWYCVQLMPEHLKENWNVYASKPAVGNEDFGFSMYDRKISAVDLTLYVEKDEERGKVNLEIYAPVLDILEESQKYNMFFIFLDMYISELYTMKYIGTVDFIEEQKQGEVVAFADLKAYIETFRGRKNLNVSDSPNQSYSVYKLNIENPQYLREDIYLGNTAGFGWINNYYNEENEKVDAAEKNGVVWGFVYYDNSEIASEEMIAFRSDIEDLYMDIMDKEKMGIHVGSATGKTYSYIDFVIFDLPAFLALTNKVAEKYNLKDCGYSPFKKDARVIVFTE
ncbi:MAG: hypothetical protein LIP01_07705 [Tannerellaceae bacterium]|nr:hypothetical protein [Tannerellaceae bacterium]